MKEKEIFAQRMYTALQKRNMTQKVLANTVNVSEGTASKWLNANSPEMPKADKLMTLANTLEVSADWLLGLSDRERTNDQISLRDIGEVLLQCIKTPAVNMKTAEVQAEEYCVDDYGTGQSDGEKRVNKYTALYFSARSECDDYGPEEDNTSPCGAALSEFVRLVSHYHAMYRRGDLSKEEYDLLINNQMKKLNTAPLPSADS